MVMVPVSNVQNKRALLLFCNFPWLHQQLEGLTNMQRINSHKQSKQCDGLWQRIFMNNIEFTECILEIIGQCSLYSYTFKGVLLFLATQTWEIHMSAGRSPQCSRDLKSKCWELSDMGIYNWPLVLCKSSKYCHPASYLSRFCLLTFCFDSLFFLQHALYIGTWF